MDIAAEFPVVIPPLLDAVGSHLLRQHGDEDAGRK